jgi:hypothetical protein
MRDKMEQKQKKWEQWEAQVEAEERARREAAAAERRRPPPLFPSAPTQRAFQESDQARAIEDAKIDDFQRRLAERVRARQRRSDRWLPPQTDEVVAERARAAARESRRAAEEEAAALAAADAAAAAQFLQGRVRQKASRFAELVGNLQDAQAERDPYRRREEDEEGVAAAAAGRRRRQQPQAEQRWAPAAQPAEPYLPPDVVRVERDAFEEIEEEDSGGVWVAGTDSAGLQRLSEEERWVQDDEARVVEVWQERTEGQQQGRWASDAGTPPVRGDSGQARGSGSDDEYIDW